MRVLPKQARQILHETRVRQLRSDRLQGVCDPLSCLRYVRIGLGNQRCQSVNESSACSVS